MRTILRGTHSMFTDTSSHSLVHSMNNSNGVSIHISHINRGKAKLEGEFSNTYYMGKLDENNKPHGYGTGIEYQNHGTFVSGYWSNGLVHGLCMCC